VWFAGFNDNPYTYMKRADVFVLSSLWEGFGNVVVEAMAVGAAVVATDCPYGPSEIIRNADEGVLVAPGDDLALATAVLSLLGDDERRLALAQAGRRRAQDFAAEPIAASYAAIFDEVLGESRAAAEAAS
jgi:glycosyltransferase involved in cell wall biosynthesis